MINAGFFSIYSVQEQTKEQSKQTQVPTCNQSKHEDKHMIEITNTPQGHRGTRTDTQSRDAWEKKPITFQYGTRRKARKWEK